MSMNHLKQGALVLVVLCCSSEHKQHLLIAHVDFFDLLLDGRMIFAP